MTPKRGDAPLEVVKYEAIRPAPPVLAAPEPDGGEGEPSLAEYLAIVIEARWIIAAAVAAALSLGAAYAFLAAPVYRSDVLLQVEEKKGGMGGLSDLSALFAETSPADAEIEIIRSRGVVGAVVDELHLDVVAVPRRFPLVGGAIARHRGARGPAPALLGLASFAWGGEKIQVERLEVPAELIGKTLALVARGAGRFDLLDPGGERLVEGEVGRLSKGRGAEVLVTELRAREGTRFRLVRREREDAIADLQLDLKVAEKGKKTGILQVTLEGRDRALIAAILDGLARAYVKQNVDRRSAEAQQTLAFLNTQVPLVHSNLDKAEVAMRDYLTSHGSVDLDLEAQTAIGRAAEVEKAMAELQVERAALRARFTEGHPAIAAVDQKIARLETEKGSMERRMRRLPGSELESARRMRDVKVATELYTTLIDKVEELNVVKSGTIGNVRVLDAALFATEPTHPKKAPVLGLSLLLGVALGLAAAFARRSLFHGVEDPDDVERATGIPVYASVPHSPAQEARARRTRKSSGVLDLLAVNEPKDLAVESLRSLRTSIQFGLLEARNNVIAIGGPAPGAGKSFISVNLAHLLGEQGRRVLVLDADLRRGHLHRYFEHRRAPGLSDVIRGDVQADAALYATPSPGVTFLATGTIPPNPSELLGSERFQHLLSELSERFDVVFVDTPPILAVTDAALVARHAGLNLLVLKSASHPIREIQHAVRQLGRGGIRVHGFVMNGVRLDRGLGRKGAYHYQYRYE